MPDAMPTRLPLAAALDEGLAILFRRLQAEPAPRALVALADRLEAAHPPIQVAWEGRAIR
jgi:hypothetical protein